MGWRNHAARAAMAFAAMFGGAAHAAHAEELTGIPQVLPGESFAFAPAPNVVDGVVDSNLNGHSAVFAGQSPLEAYAFGVVSGAKASATIFQYHEFDVPESLVVGAEPGVVLQASVAGAAQIRGFLFTMGGASASASVDVKVLDVTDDREAPVLVFSGNVAEYREDGFFGASVEGSANVEGQAGFPYVGFSGGGGIAVGVGIEPHLQMVRDQVSFSFPLLVRRGRSYRMLVELSVGTHNRVIAATSIARFSSLAMGAPAVPNELDPDPDPVTKGAENSWRTILGDYSAGSLGTFATNKGSADLETGGGLFTWSFKDSEDEKMLGSGPVLQKIFGSQTVSMNGLAKSNFMKLSNMPAREILEAPGVLVSGLTLTLGNDPVERESRLTNRDIERSLRDDDRLASLYLPASAGGEWERMVALVDRLITDSELAGLATNNARLYLDKALLVVAQDGDYKKAFKSLSTAYRQLVKD